MLDSLGSTLSSETVDSFTRNGKKPVEDELTVDEAIRCLEMQVGRPPNEKKRVVPVEEGGSLLDLSTPGTPGGSSMGMGMSRSLSAQTPPQLRKLNFSGPPMRLLQDLEVSPDDGALKVPPPAQSAYPTEFSQQPLPEAAASVSGGAQKTLPSSYPARQSSGTSSDAEDSSGSGSNSGSSSEDTFERDQRQELPYMSPPAAEQESRDGHHHPRGCVRERGLGEDRQDRRWEFRHC